MAIKSAKRVLDVFELFDEEQRELTVMEIVRGLGIPQSSASVLLQELVDLGYLSFNRTERRYCPTAQVALLGNWLYPTYFRDGRLLSLMDELTAETGLRVSLAVRLGLAVRYIYIAPGAAKRPLRLGTTFPLMRCGFGRLFLTQVSEPELRSLVMHWNSTQAASEAIRFDTLLDELQGVRRDGYVVSTDRVAPDAASVCVLLPVTHGERSMGIGLGGKKTAVVPRQDECVERLNAVVMKLSTAPH